MKSLPSSYAFIAFESNAKSFAIAIISFVFSTANLDKLTKAACRIFQIC